MELNALTRLESLANDLSKLRVRRRVASLDPGEHQSRTLQFFNDDFPRFGGDKSITFFDKTEKSRRRLWHILRILVRRALRRFGKGFMIGASIQVLYVCSRAILSKTSRKALKKPHTLKALGLSKIMQFGSFIGTFLTIFEIGMVLNQVLLSRRDSNPSTMAIIGTNSECWATVDQHYDSLLSKSTLAVGGLAGLSLWLAPRSYHTPLAIFFGIRGLEIASKLLCEKGYLPSIPHSDILLMSLSSSQVLFAWLFKRESLDSAYAGFIDYQSGTAKPVYNAYRQAMMGEPLSESTLQVLNEHRLEKGLKPFIPESMSICSILHPECENCLIAACVFAVNSLRRTVPVYVPVYFIPLFAFRTKKVLEDPWYTALHTILGIVRSAAFLSSFSAIAWLTSCLQTNLGFHSTLTGYVAGLFAGTAVALEKKPRRIEISLYTLSRALTSIHYNISRFLASKDIVIRVPELNIICFAFTSALFCHTFVWRPALLRPGYYLLLKWMIGSGVSNILSQEDNEISDGESSTSSEEVDLVK